MIFGLKNKYIHRERAEGSRYFCIDSTRFFKIQVICNSMIRVKVDEQ